MMAIASVVPNFLMGVIVGAGIQAIFILICGFFQLPNDIPKNFGRYPITHISFYYWSFQGQSKNHFQGLVINNESLFFREFRKISGDYLLQNILQINVHRSKWVDLAVTCSMVAIYRIIFFVMIKISDDVTPWVRGYIARRRLEKVKKKN
ncbi:ABC transporter G family member 11-like [Asparagus officinalis]|uniref:ABC transporter G family member 11-like n=1 Tax=Asparagus officinalis TaxID=4686 RepID=UPI00098E645C|nr:ABC transporter G family member 11-like [Asparagus officinalis]